MTKIILCFLLCSAPCLFAQTIHFDTASYRDSLLFEKNMPPLAEKVMAQYDASDKKTYFEKLYKLQIVAGQYGRVTSTIKKFAYAAYQDSVDIADIAFPFRLYAESMSRKPESAAAFDTIFLSGFRRDYPAISPQYQANALQYFLSEENFSKAPLNQSIAALHSQSELTLTQALDLCCTYSNYKVYAATRIPGKMETEKIESDLYVKEDKLLQLPNGSSISIMVYRDKKRTAAQPVIMMYDIYAGRESARCKNIVAKGYTAVIANTRGKRLSPDAIEPFEHDADDAYNIIDWVSRQPWCNGKIGMYGGSYLGFSQWSAAKKLHPALKTIVPQVAVGAGIDFPDDEGIFMGYMLQWLKYVSNTKYTDTEVRNDSQKWNGVYSEWFQKGLPFRSLDSISGKKDVIFQRWLNHPAYDSYWQHMTPQKEEFSKINIPILTTTGYYDDDQRGAMHYFKEYQKYNKSGNYYLVIGPYDHGGAQGFPRKELGGYSIDPEADLPINKLVFEWFDYILKDGKKPEILQDKVNFEVMGNNEWRHVPSLEAMHNGTLKYYLGDQTPDGNFTLSQSRSKTKFFLQTIDMADRTTVPLDDNDEIMAGISEIATAKLHRKNPQLCFLSDPVSEPLAISGGISVSLDFSINKKDVDLLVDLYEQKPDGSYLFLNQQRQRASLSADRCVRHLLKPGKKQHIVISDTFITSRQLEKGSRIVVLVGVLKSPNWQVNYGSGKDVSDETIDDAGNPMQIKWFNTSAVTLPILH